MDISTSVCEECQRLREIASPRTMDPSILPSNRLVSLFTKRRRTVNRSPLLLGSMCSILLSLVTNGIMAQCLPQESAFVTTHRPSSFSRQTLLSLSNNHQDEPTTNDDSVFRNNPRSRGFLLRRYTGDATPFTFPVRPIRLVKEWPKDCPFDPKTDFSRMDETNDRLFYQLPKLVYHIDEPAVASLTQYYRRNIPPGSDILDICSSWVSHYPLEFPQTMSSICATGLNGLELALNDQLTGGYKVVDLNANNAKLDYPDESFDVVTCVVSIDYLIRPMEVLQEVHRVLRPGGKVIVSQSNRCFFTKAIKLWLDCNDRQRLEVINAFFQYAGGYVVPCKAYDITATLPNPAVYRDPMFVVEAIKES